MIRKTVKVLANPGVDTVKLPNKAPYAARFNIRADIDRLSAYRGKDIICTQSPRLGNITRYFNFYGREPGQCTVTARLKSTRAIIAVYTIECYAWVAHRGYMGVLRPLDDRPVKSHTVSGVKYKSVEMTTHYTENTQAAFEMAIQAGAYGLETDPKLTKDGRLIVLHDLVYGGTAYKGKPYQHKYHDALTNGPKDTPIYGCTLAEVNRMRVRRIGSKTPKPSQNRIMLFSAYLDLCDKYGVHPVIDLSIYANEPAQQVRIAQAVAKELKKHPVSKRLVLALPGTYKILAAAMGLKDPNKILYKYDLTEDNIADHPKGRYKALLNDPPYPRELASWEQIKKYEWFK